MLSKNDVRDSLVHEYKVIKQLVSKLPGGSEDYRLSENQRSTIELLRYLTLVGPGIIHAGLEDGFAWFGANGPAVEKLTLAEVPAHLDGAIAEINTLFENMSDEEFANKPVSVPGMGDWTMNTWLMNTACKFVPAYKLMLFHHAKAAGNGDIGTWDAWMDNGEVPAPTAS
jgi:hypothetical protein